MLVNYTWSETMEAASFLNPQFNLTQLERARVSEDLPQRLTILGGYAPSFFKTSHGVDEGAAGGMAGAVDRFLFIGTAIERGGRVFDRGESADSHDGCSRTAITSMPVR